MIMITAHFLVLLVFSSLLPISSAAPNKNALRKILVPGNSDTESNREKVREIIEKAYSQFSKLPAKIELPWNVTSTLGENGINSVLENNSTEKTITEINSNVLDYMFEGDILLNEEQATAIAQQMSQNGARSKRQALTDPVYLWDIRYSIPFEFSDNLSVEKRNNVFKAMLFWMEKSCLSFGQNPNAPSRLFITSADGCYSLVGRQPYDVTQIVSIGDGCNHIGTIAHELTHALGFFHTQSRMDRNNYVKINFGNIKPSDWLQFEKHSSQTLNLPYDYGSNMHYGSSAFAINKNLSNMHTLDLRYQNTIGIKHEPSFSDVRAVNKLYQCPSKCENTVNCENCGFIDSKTCNSCICPPYFGGATCNERAIQRESTCFGEVLQAQTGVWKTFSGTVESWRERLSADCVWHIKAPQGTKIQLKVDEFPQSACVKQCPRDSIEVNPGKFDVLGMKICCTSLSSGLIISESNMVAIRAFVRGNLNFKISYRSVPQLIKPSLNRCNAVF